MNLNDVRLVFGNYSKAAKILGVSRQAVRQWPNDLTDHLADRVIGCCVRKGISVPAEVMERFMEKSVA